MAKKGEKLSEAHKEKLRLKMTGRKASPETRQKMSLAHLKRYEDPAQRELTSQRGKGRPVSQESREKASKSLKEYWRGRVRVGTKHTEEWKAATSKRMIGFRHSEETKKKLSTLKTGKKSNRVWSKEQREAQSARLTGNKFALLRTAKSNAATSKRMTGNQFAKGYHRKLSEEHKRKISIKLKGQVRSEGHKRRISELNRGRIRSAEVRIRISERQRGKRGFRHSEEAKTKMREARVIKRMAALRNSPLTNLDTDVISPT